MSLISWLRVAEMSELSDQQRLEAHEKTLTSKPKFQELVIELQEEMIEMASRNRLDEAGGFLELGTGVMPMKRLDSRIESSDVVAGPNIDRIIDAQNMDISDNSLSTIFAQNVFHHLDDPAKFLNEVARVLRPGGVLILLEPYHNRLSRLLYPRLFRSETFDMAGSWKEDKVSAMVGANQALSHIVFVRDQEKYRSSFPGLEIVETNFCGGGVRYLLSGGLNFKQLAPSITFPHIKRLENFDRKGALAIHWLVALRAQ